MLHIQRPYLNRGRVTVAALTIVLIFGSFWLFSVRGLASIDGSNTGSVPQADFTVFWTASEVTLDGHAELAYDESTLFEKQQEATGRNQEWSPWLYPPTGLFFILPLGLLSLAGAYVLWSVATLALTATAVQRIARDKTALLLALAFPATLFNLTIGQNGLLTAGLFAWGMLLLPSRPVVAGAVLGLLAFKPQLFPLIFLALLAGRQRNAAISAFTCAAGVALASLGLFGFDAWQGFRTSLSTASSLLYDGVFPLPMMQSLTASLLLLGVSAIATQVIQGAVAIAMGALVIWLWRRDTAYEYKVAGLGLATLLTTPYAHHHDLTLMGVAMLYYGLRARSDGWRAWDKEVLVLAWLEPMLSVGFGLATGVNIAPLLVAVLLYAVVRRVRLEDAAADRAPDERPALASAA